MKKILLSAVSVAALTGSAFAADLPYHKAPIVAPQPPMWTGFYAGLNLGYSWGTNRGSYSETWSGNSWQQQQWLSSSSPEIYIVGQDITGGQINNSISAGSQSGIIGGIQLGYNHQFKENLLLGFETDIQGTGIQGGGATNSSLYGESNGISGLAPDFVFSASQIGYSSTVFSSGLDYLGTARGKFGYNLTPSLVAYATGGLAYGNAWAKAYTVGASNTYGYLKYNFGLGSIYPEVNQLYAGQETSQNSLLVGYSVGGGVEWMFKSDWSIKLEALYYNLGNMNITSSSISGPAAGNKMPNPNNSNDILYTSTAASIMSSNTNIDYQGVIARAGVNYHFNFASAPVVAKF